MENISYIFGIICSLVLPVLLAIIYLRKNKKYLKPILLGALTFFVFQILIRVPILQLALPQATWYNILIHSQPILYALFLGATAAIFEETGRYIVIKIFLKKQLTADDGISFGIGHGGIEAILLVGINYIYLLVTKIYEFAPEMIFLGGIERVFAIAVHIGMSVMVMKSIREKHLIWFVLALIIHTLIDVFAVLVLNVYILEIIMLAFAVVSLLFIKREKKNEKIY